MSRLCLRAWGGLVASIACASLTGGCGATRRGAAAPGDVGGLAAPTATLQVDVAPVRALAFAEPFLWIGSDRGLRRVRWPAGAAEWVRPEGAGAAGPRRGVSALAVEPSGALLVASGAGLVRLMETASGAAAFRVQPVASLSAITHLAPVTVEAGGAGIWAGTANGLYFVAGGAAQPITDTQGAAVTSLDLDADGSSAWVGLRGRGLVRVQAGRITVGVGPAFADHADFVESLGTAVLPNGTRIAVGRGARGEGRVALLRLDGPEVLVAQPDVPVIALIQRAGAPLLLAGPAGAPRAYALALADRGQVIDDGIRFTPARKSLQSLRLVARAEPTAVPPDVTVGLMGGDDVFVGTRSVGVARVGGAAVKGGGVDFLPVGELALDARGLSVACLERERCIFATGAGPGWIWDGRAGAVRPIPDGDVGGGLMALAGDGRATVYFIAAAGAKALAIARLSSDGASWQPLVTLPVAVEGTPQVTFATISPQGNLWLAVRDRTASGQEFGRGVIEIALPAGRAVHHRAYRANEARPPDAIPVVGAVNAIRFQQGTGGDPDAIWFCGSEGVTRFFAGQLSEWGENEGLDSETCHDLEIAGDGTVWAATAAGPARFDGKRWFRLGGGGPDKVSGPTSTSRWPVDNEAEPLAARALVPSGKQLWAGTAVGIWPVTTVASPLNRASGQVDDDVVDLVGDRFGRLWVLGHIGITVRDLPR